jgi:hypothetical protein
MSSTKTYLILLSLLVSSCQAGGDSSQPGPKKSSTDESLTPVDNGDVNDGNSVVGTLTGDAKCWKKMLETPEYLACKNSGKIFNRIKKKCVDDITGLSLTNDCSLIKAEDIQDAHSKILTELPKAHLTTDQCGSYELNGRKHGFAYIMGQQFDEASEANNNGASYKIRVRKICYYTASNDTSNNATNQVICADPKLDLTNQSATDESLGSCD